MTAAMSREGLLKALDALNDALRAVEPAANPLGEAPITLALFADPTVVALIGELAARGFLINFTLQQLAVTMRAATQRGDKRRVAAAWDAGWSEVMVGECRCVTCSQARESVAATVERVRAQVQAEGRA